MRWILMNSRRNNPSSGSNSRPPERHGGTAGARNNAALLALAMAILWGLASRLAAQEVGSEPPIDYLRDIKPILTKRCISCHGAEKPRGRLRLDTAAAAIRGGDLGPAVVPGDPEASELWLAVRGEGSGERMPLKRPPLSEREIEALRAWIDAGAPSPADEEPGMADGTHWAFRAPIRPTAPTLASKGEVHNPIDAFIRSPLEQDGIAPSPEADRATLIRRVSLDVIGLPPTPAQLAAFLGDARPDAYERMIDRLLASPHYGERWGRWWLDMARYADSHGYSIDGPRSIWPYRDWVIDALNRDQPFDEFTIDQIAGDLRPDATLAQRVATGFHRNTPINMEGGIDKEQFRVESVIDRVNTTGTVWLGLTIGCAQCHDHKYDPIQQKDYYRLFAFLNNCDEPELPVASPEDVERQRAVRERIAAFLASIEDDPELRRLQGAWETGLSPAQRQNLSEEVRKALDVPLERRDADANRPAFAVFVEQARDPALKVHREALADLRREDPRIETTLVVRERDEPRVTHLLQGGDFTRPGAVVTPGVPGVLPALESPTGRTPDRMDLARWLVDRGNPLTARVVVNRLWQVYFGRGLVETDADFGAQGAPPSHPELLDWLAVELVERGWSLKAIHRLILTSATYRQSSRNRPDLAATDPDNRRLARQSRVRLDAELVRDSALTSSGLLVPILGGPSVFPPQPDGVMNLGQLRREWNADTGPGRYRRGLYTHIWRATPHPLLTVFDAPDATHTCTRRLRSNTPLQALLLLNDEAFVECAEALARRVLAEGPRDDAGRIDYAFNLTLTRAPTESERRRLLKLLSDEKKVCGSDGDEQNHERSSWVSVARVLLNLDEFITRE
jgi:mono/diheme cytochrome c family protein